MASFLYPTLSVASLRFGQAGMDGLSHLLWHHTKGTVDITPAVIHGSTARNGQTFREPYWKAKGIAVQSDGYLAFFGSCAYFLLPPTGCEDDCIILL